ncbi:MAG: amidohydrolase family protein [Pseudomonadota bacterium]
MPTTIVQNVHVIDTALEHPLPNASLVIENGRIREVAKEAPHLKDAIVFDGNGLYALPGLIDCHTHPTLTQLNLRALEDVPQTLMAARAANILNDMLMRGFTSIRDAAGADWGLKTAVEEGAIIGPRMFISGRALSQTGGHGDVRSRTDVHVPCACESALAGMTEFADGVDDIRKSVRELFRQGADQIKIMVSGGVASPNDPLECNQYSPEEIETVVEEAHRRESYVMAHAYGADAIKVALHAGVRSIEHGTLVNQEAAELAHAKGAFVVPTLTMPIHLLQDNDGGQALPAFASENLNRIRNEGFRAIDIWKKAGVKLGFGTDLLGDTYHLQSQEFLHRAEVESPRDVLHSATRVNAEILQMEGVLGVIAEGAIADLILVDGNPVDDLTYLQHQGRHLKLIMKQGTVVKNELH